jgi:iron complex outermembrane receptor protein
VGPLVDQDSAGRAAADPTYNPAPQQVTTFSGGNADLVPEISKTTTVGATFSPKYLPGFNLSVDYYDISISGAITTLSASNLTLACRNGSAAACARITRNAAGTVVEVASNSQNIAEFKTRGYDIEASYVLQMSTVSSNIPGTLRTRALATYVKEFVFDTGVSRVDTAGDVGSSTPNAIPNWRGTLSLTYQNSNFGIDARARYVGKGQFNHLLEGILVNNEVKAFTYVDLGAQFKATEKFTVTMNVNNVFDKAPPISPTGPIFYDAIGSYFTFGARATF